MDISGVWNRAP